MRVWRTLWPALPTAADELRGLLDDKDRNVAATAAIAMARQGDAEVAERLLAAVNDEDLPLPARCDAVEALGLLPGDTHTATLQKLVDRYGQFTPGASTGYQVDLHAELLRALAGILMRPTIRDSLRRLMSLRPPFVLPPWMPGRATEKGTVPTTMRPWCPRNGPPGTLHKLGPSPFPV